MNEQIAKLAEQAGMVKILRQHAHEYGAGTFEDTEYPELEKFAELIVRECIDICKERHWTWRWDETTSGPNECANIIKERFGVEE